MALSDEIEKPELPEKSPGKPKKNPYKKQFGVIVLAEDEERQKALFEAFRSLGLKCRVVNT